MPEKEMTTSKAIIILDRLNTDGRIKVDREELREAIGVIKDALRKQIPTKMKSKDTLHFRWKACPSCGTKYTADTEEDQFNYCEYCGQALDWT